MASRSSERQRQRRPHYQRRQNREQEQRNRLLLLITAVIIALALTVAAVFILFSGRQQPVTTLPSPVPSVEPRATDSAAAVAAALTPTATPQRISTPSGVATLPAMPRAVAPSPTPLSLPPPDLGHLEQHMLTLINAAREEAGLSHLSWDGTAARAAKLHAEDMVAGDYLSHWNEVGLGPDHRYSLLGAPHAVAENLSAPLMPTAATAKTSSDLWTQLVNEAHSGLLTGTSDRANILAPFNTHVGIGMAYSPDEQRFRIVQMFSRQHVRLRMPLPSTGTLGQVFSVTGYFLANDASTPSLQLLFEPSPEPLTRKELSSREIYASAAEVIFAQPIEADFNEEVVLPPEGKSGLYHIRLLAEFDGQPVPVVDHVLVVDHAP